MVHDPSAPPSTFHIFVRIHFPRHFDSLDGRRGLNYADSPGDSGAANTWTSLRVTTWPWTETASACLGQSS